MAVILSRHSWSKKNLRFAHTWLLYFPASQLEQEELEVCPRLGCYNIRASQLEQNDEPARLYFPASQLEQEELARFAPLGCYTFPRHSWSKKNLRFAPLGCYTFQSSQLQQEDCPTWLLYFPASQLEQEELDVCPTWLLYFPASQLEQEDRCPTWPLYFSCRTLRSWSRMTNQPDVIVRYHAILSSVGARRTYCLSHFINISGFTCFAWLWTIQFDPQDTNNSDYGDTMQSCRHPKKHSRDPCVHRHQYPRQRRRKHRPHWWSQRWSSKMTHRHSHCDTMQSCRHSKKHSRDPCVHRHQYPRQRRI